MRSFAFAISFVLYILSACQTKGKPDTSGVISLKFKLYKAAATPAFEQESKIWYKDSFAIEEIKSTNFHTNADGIQTVKEVIKHYTLIDLHSSSFYNYRNLSDTATIIRKYQQHDSVFVEGGWNFYYKKNIDFIEPPENLVDTSVNNVLYKRVKFKRKQAGYEYYSIAFFRCDRKNLLFSIYQFEGYKGCLMEKIYDYRTGEMSPENSVEVNFLSDTLSVRELKIFAAWEKNAKENPVR